MASRKCEPGCTCKRHTNSGGRPCPPECDCPKHSYAGNSCPVGCQCNRHSALRPPCPSGCTCGRHSQPRPPSICACGCGAETKHHDSTFLPGHNARVAHPMRGRSHSADARAKIRAARAKQTNVGGPSERRPAVERFLGKVVIPSDCWVWTGARSPTGYGVFGVGSTRDGSAKVVSAHRFAYEFWVGPIPDGLEIDHLCNDRSCVNPDHLEPVTHAENIDRAVVRRRVGRAG